MNGIGAQLLATQTAAEGLRKLISKNIQQTFSLLGNVGGGSALGANVPPAAGSGFQLNVLG